MGEGLVWGLAVAEEGGFAACKTCWAFLSQMVIQHASLAGSMLQDGGWLH